MTRMSVFKLGSLASQLASEGDLRMRNLRLEHQSLMMVSDSRDGCQCIRVRRRVRVRLPAARQLP